MIKDAIKNRSSELHITTILNVAAFLGKRFYDSILKSLDKSKTSKHKFPAGGARSLYSSTSIKSIKGSNKYSEEQLSLVLESELTEIANKMQNRKNTMVENYPKLLWEANNLDCYLYAQDNRYRK